MKLYCVYSQQFDRLFKQFFEPSLRRTDPQVEVVTDVIEVKGNADFRSPGFNQALIYKWKRGLELVTAHQGEIVLFTDVDIVFHRPLLPEILSALGDADIAATRETTGDVRHFGFNVGVLALRCSNEVQSFVSKMLDRMILRGEWDQNLFNILLPESSLRTSALPLTFANGRIPYNDQSVLFHATRTEPREGKSSMEQKLEALSKAEQYFANARLNAPEQIGGVWTT